jgi:hypothetical protein
MPSTISRRLVQHKISGTNSAGLDHPAKLMGGRHRADGSPPTDGVTRARSLAVMRWHLRNGIGAAQTFRVSEKTGAAPVQVRVGMDVLHRMREARGSFVPRGSNRTGQLP